MSETTTEQNQSNLNPTEDEGSLTTVDHETESTTRDLVLKEHSPKADDRFLVAFLDEEPQQSSTPSADQWEKEHSGLWGRANSNLSQGHELIADKKYSDAQKELERARTQYETILKPLEKGALPDNTLGGLLEKDIHSLYTTLAGTYSERAAEENKAGKATEAKALYEKAAEALLAYRDICRKHDLKYNTEAFKKASSGDTVELEAADNLYNAGNYAKAVGLYQEAFLDEALSAEQRARVVPFMQGCYERGKLDIAKEIKTATEPLKAQLHALHVQILNNSSDFDGAIEAADAFIKTYGESTDEALVAQRQQVSYLGARACYWKAAALLRGDSEKKWQQAAEVYKKALSYLQSDDYASLLKSKGNEKSDINITYKELLHVSQALYGTSLVYSGGNSEAAYTALSQALTHGGKLTAGYTQQRDQAAVAYAQVLSDQKTVNWQRVYDLAHPVANNNTYLGKTFQRQAAGLLEEAEEQGGIKGVSGN